MAAIYQVVSATVPSYTGSTPTLVQVDAPAGYFVTSTYTDFQGEVRPLFGGGVAFVVDEQDRLTGAIFGGVGQDDPEVSADYTGCIVCVLGTES